MRSLLLLLIACLVAMAARAQREWDTWCVGADTCAQIGITGYGVFNRGTGTQINFSSTGPRLGNPVARLGSGAYSDAQGNLLFYTNGVNAYDRLSRILPGGKNLCDRLYSISGGLLAGRAAIHPVPGHTGQFYLFYFKSDPARPQVNPLGLGVLTYAIVDITANGGYGAVVKRDVALWPTNQPKLALVRHPNNVDFWIITQGSQDQGFNVFRVSAAGVATQPITSLVGEAAYSNSWLLRSSPDGQHLISEGNRPLDAANGGPIVEHGLYLYDFDNLTGQVSRERLVWRGAPFDLTRTPVNKYYNSNSPHFFEGASFSPDSRLLYTVEYRVSQDAPTGGVRYDRGTDLVQYDVTQLDAASIQQSRLLLTSGLAFTQPSIYYGRFDNIQLASNGTLWTFDWQELSPLPSFDICYGPKSMTEIAQPNRRGLACDLRLQVFPLAAATIDPLVLPGVVTNMLFAPTALLAKISCDSVQLWANSQQTRPAGRWDFGDPSSGAANTATGYLVAHHYSSGGLHRVTLTYPDGLVLSRDVDVPAGEADFTGANIITPNGDGLNDAFQPLGRGQLSPTARLQVFSRWGQRVYEASGPTPTWAAEGITDGVYFWLLSYPDCAGQLRQHKGTVTVVH